MKKTLQMLLAVFVLLPVFAFAEVTYLSEEEYKELSSDEREAYNKSLTDEMAELQIKKSEAIATKEMDTVRIEEIKAELANIRSEYNTIYDRVLAKIGVNKSEIPAIKAKLDMYNRKLANWQNLSDDELWAAKKEIKNLNNDFDSYKQTKYAKVPDLRPDFIDVENKFLGINESLNNARPKYYEEDYSVKNGDNLSKISGYSFIYGDTSKWGIIYRANRDQIKDPNLIHPDMVLKIPRGLPYSWKVYKGESLWKIASYPEVYSSGAKWPVIYRANQDKIKDPNIIHPNMELELPRD